MSMIRESAAGYEALQQGVVLTGKSAREDLATHIEVLYPPELWLALNEDQWNGILKAKELEHCGDQSYEATLDTFGCVTQFRHTRTGQEFVIITFNLDPEDPPVDFFTLAGLVAHEAYHCVQWIWRTINELDPGEEASAYLQQHITQTCLAQIVAEGIIPFPFHGKFPEGGRGWSRTTKAKKKIKTKAKAEE